MRSSVRFADASYKYAYSTRTHSLLIRVLYSYSTRVGITRVLYGQNILRQATPARKGPVRYVLYRLVLVLYSVQYYEGVCVSHLYDVLPPCISEVQGVRGLTDRYA